MPEDVSEKVSKEKLENELEGIEKRIEKIEGRVQDLEDQDMMAELEALSIEDEVREVEDILNHMSREELEKRLNMVEQIKEEYQEGKVHEKLEYLYEQVKDLQEDIPEEARSGDSKLSERIDRLEQRLEGTTEEGMPEKYRKAVKSNYSQLKQARKEIEEIKNELQGSPEEDSYNIDRIERRLDELKNLEEQVEELQEFEDEIRSKLEGNEKRGGETGDLSYIEFDLKAIKKRLSELEDSGINQKLDQSQLRDIRKRVKKLERTREELNQQKLEALRKDMEKRLSELEEDAVAEEQLDEELEEMRGDFEDRLRQLSSEIDRAVREGEQRLSNLENTVEEGVFEVEDSQENVSERVDEMLEIVENNQDYIEELENRLQSTSRKLDRKLDELEKGPRPEEPRSDEEPGSDELEALEAKIDNLAEHVIRNQERLHELQKELKAQELGEGSSRDDITIIS